MSAKKKTETDLEEVRNQTSFLSLYFHRKPRCGSAATTLGLAGNGMEGPVLSLGFLSAPCLFVNLPSSSFCVDSVASLAEQMGQTLASKSLNGAFHALRFLLYKSLAITERE